VSVSRLSLRFGAHFRTGQFDAPSLFAQCACAFDGCKCRSSCLHVLTLRGGGDDADEIVSEYGLDTNFIASKSQMSAVLALLRLN